jgi:hypothetical protein
MKMGWQYLNEIAAGIHGLSTLSSGFVSTEQSMSGLWFSG